jgi:hypothetical protein
MGRHTAAPNRLNITSGALFRGYRACVFSAPARAWWAALGVAAAVLVLCGAGDEPVPILDPVPKPVPEPDPPPPLNEVIR